MSAYRYERRAVAERGPPALLMIGAVCGLVAVLYAESFAAMARMWQYSDYRHGAIVFPISAYLIWRLRGPLARVEMKPWPWGIGALLGVVLLWYVARAVGVQAAEFLAAVLLIPAAVLVLLGPAFTRRAIFPLLFLVTAVPVGDALLPYLMQVTADVSAALLRTTGVPVFRDGQFLTLPGGDFEVADICAGLRYLISGAIVALLFAYLTYRQNWKRVVFVTATASAMIVGNGVRAFVVMFVASATNMRVFAGRDHVYFGWLLFAAIIVVLFWVGARFADAGDANVRGVSQSDWRGGRLASLILVLGLVMLAATARPFEKAFGSTWLLLLPAGALLLWVLYKRFGPIPDAAAGEALGSDASYRRAGGALIVCVALLVLAAGPVLTTERATRVSPHLNAVELPAIADCGAPEAWSASWRPEFQGPDIAVSGTYRCSGRPVNVFVAAYASNTQGKELVSDSNRPIPAAWLRYTTIGKNVFETRDGTRVEVNEVQVQGLGPPSLVWYWYNAGGSTATSPAAVKLVQVAHLILRGYADGSVYLLQTTLDASPDSSRERLSAAARAVAALSIIERGGDST